MTPKNRNRMTLLSILATIIIFACQAGGTPTATPVPPTAIPPTSVPPTATLEPTATLAPTEAPVESPTEEATGSSDPIIAIDQVHGFFDIYDTLNVVGLVTNNTDRAVDNVEIEVEVFDASDVSLYTETVYIDLYALAPGETSPFSLYIFDDLPSADNFVATVVGNSVTDLERATVDVANSVMTLDDDGNIHLTGELVNNTDQPVNVSSLAGAVFNANGDLMVSESYNVTIRYLDPGQSGPFRITMTGPDSGTADITDYQVYIDAEITDPIDPINLTISDAVNYLDGFDNLHLVGQLTNDTDKVWSAYLVAGLYDANGMVIDAASLTLPINALKPGEFSPYDFDFWGPTDSTAGLMDAATEYTVQIDAYWTWETSTELLDMTTANDVNEFDDFGGTFTGQVVNNTGGPIDAMTIVVYLVDKESGVIVATDYTYLYEEIADGGTLDYTVYLDPEDGFDINTAEYYIIVKGERP